ncbi:uncharacterized protein LOC106063482 isoform X1 [Biomphalaria glabrata]|uniref:Uncharacterized protein LOC106063482 isoform X1 n=2 Tax=Biomphalaria TaxID=6525 RepID=A0A2C9KHW0_BIOGL|nr:uncharacterized protein LOC106063482 isoform X1 [Biomphalaria glabrata]XP_055868188.1 uncharacterized protein LOC106063482 isoform X1 [Biomphalaria glabrata]KAI8772530.1 hypothetical protein BgiBS90_027010 [Biomphalaria glabrata]KAK0066445.1 hypothetical protein Bpfe_003877 [Biomphalaria pfeifferi]
MDAFYNNLMRKLLPDFDNRSSSKKYRPTASAVREPSMQDYVERRLTEVHYVAKDYKFCDKFLGVSLAALLLILMPYLHIGVFYLKIWVPDKPPIDKQACTCSCFDTVFRGRYEMPGLVTYKHVYFNSTANTFKIWIMTIMFIILFYESIKYLVSVYRNSRIRKIWFSLYLINLYPHYYSWWSFFSYYNEEFYTFFTHHMFFCVTEIFTTAVVLNLCNYKNELKSWKMMLILAINLVHIIVSGSDQFIAHVLQGRGTNFQNARNIGLMIPDVLHIIIPALEFYRLIVRSEVPFSDLCYKEEVILFILFITIGTLFGRIL